MEHISLSAELGEIRGSSVGLVGFPRRMVVHDERRPT
jgi:hypothetical protein